jgi:hypothetical protein
MIGSLKDRRVVEANKFMALYTSAEQGAAQLQELKQYRFLKAFGIEPCAWTARDDASSVEAAGKPRLEGKNYPVKDGDIVHNRCKV